MLSSNLCWAVAGDMVGRRHQYATLRESEELISVGDLDVGSFASTAVAGAAVRENLGADMARRNFWAWYLQDAVPEAFLRATRPDNGTR
ncbi:MAG: Imm5 family immunity protein [Streptosporangiaceae bacterium]